MSRACRLPSIFLTLVATFLSVGGGLGCRVFSFDRQWKRMASAPASANSPADLTGRWEGTWHSEGTGHSGRLRAIVAPANGASAGKGAVHDVHFDATWGGIFRFGETVRLDTKPGPATATATRPASVSFDDSHDAGWLGGGFYQFTGDATDTRFTCRYNGKHDHGTFEMTRVGK